VPPITGRLEVNLSVRDPVRSVSWYAALLDMERLYEFVAPDGNISYCCLKEPPSGLVLCLVGHRANPGDAFSEYRTGLDHLEFVVARREDLDDWAAHLDALGIAHSGVKTPPYTENAMLTFRDPDNIQLEFFWRAPSE
jgi:glyoxylase I family protein